MADQSKKSKPRAKRLTAKQKLEALRLVPVVVGGKRALLHKPPKEELERAIEIRIRVAISALGFLCWKHTVHTCHSCGARPTKQTGLGLGCADLICVVRGRFVAIEVKRPSTRNAKRDAHQKVWMGVVRRAGGVAGVATNEAEALELVYEAMRRPW